MCHAIATLIRSLAPPSQHSASVNESFESVHPPFAIAEDTNMFTFAFTETR